MLQDHHRKYKVGLGKLSEFRRIIHVSKIYVSQAVFGNRFPCYFEMITRDVNALDFLEPICK